MYQPFNAGFLVGFFLVAVATVAGEQAPIPSRFEPYPIDSGRRANDSLEPQVVFECLAAFDPGTPWIRMVFSEADLPAGSRVETISLQDGARQQLTLQDLEDWDMATAYFNGAVVLIRLIAAPRTRDNRIVIRGGILGGGEPQPTTATICGGNDDRQPSSDPRVGRLLLTNITCNHVRTSGCTGWIMDQPTTGAQRLHASAGHCFMQGAKMTVLQFDVPPSVPNCSIRHPVPQKQFAVIDEESDHPMPGQRGPDWAIFRCGRNPDTGRTTFEEQQGAIRVATQIPSNGAIVVRGYGVDGDDHHPGGGGPQQVACNCPVTDGRGSRNQVQQGAGGTYAVQPGFLIEHDADTCGGNSGGPILETGGAAIGIHESGRCEQMLPNGGTAINLPDIAFAIAAMQCVGPVLVSAVNSGPLNSEDKTFADGDTLRYALRTDHDPQGLQGLPVILFLNLSSLNYGISEAMTPGTTPGARSLVVLNFLSTPPGTFPLLLGCCPCVPCSLLGVTAPMSGPHILGQTPGAFPLPRLVPPLFSEGDVIRIQAAAVRPSCSDPIVVSETVRMSVGCPEFPPRAGAQWRYRMIGGTQEFTTRTEAVQERIGTPPRKVYRIRVLGDPPDLGLYVGCDPAQGELDVATDWWEPKNPGNRGRDFWVPPLFRCRYGQAAGVRCDWRGTFGGAISRELSEVLGYEKATVPRGTFECTMRMRVTEFDEFGQVDEPIDYWVDQEVGIIKGVGVNSGTGIELVTYTPSPGDGSGGWGGVHLHGMVSELLRRLRRR